MRRYFFYAAVVGLVIGIFSVSVWPNLFADVWLLVLLGGVCVVVAGRGSGASSARYLLYAACFLFFIAVGMWRTELYTQSLTPLPVAEGEVTFAAVVVAEPDERERTTHLYMQTATTTLLVFADRYHSVSYGDEVQVTGTLAAPTSFDTDLGRTFNYPKYLEARGVTNVVYRPTVAVTDHDQGNVVITTLLFLKQQFITQIQQYLPEPHAGLAMGLLLGVKQALGDNLEAVFRSTGIIHIVVLSGYNIMLVVTFILYVLSFVLPWRGRLLFGLLAIVAFALIVGLSATVLRASLMAALALIARSFGRTYSVMHGLFVAGVIMLLFNPYLLVYDVGFQLSFIATLGLIAVAPYLEASLHRVPVFIGVREFLVATLATQLCVLPLLLYQIGEFSVVAVVVNVLVLPMVPVAMLLVFLMVIVSLFSVTLATFVSFLSYAALSYIVMVPSWFAVLPFASFVVPPFPFVVVVFLYVAIFYGIWWWKKPNDPLAGWTIEEELETPSVGQVTTETATPVFFR